MTLSRPIKVLVAALTIWPIVYVFLFVAFIALSIIAITGGPARLPETNDGPPIWFGVLVVAHLGTMAIGLAVIAFYIVYLFKTDRVEEGPQGAVGRRPFHGRPQVALAWLLQQRGITAPIIGASRLGHLEDAMAALALRLTSEELASLETPYVPHPVAGL